MITEKLDGSNAAVVIEEFGFGEHVDPSREIPSSATLVFGPVDEETGIPDKEYLVAAQKRTSFCTPGPKTDNYGFAQWVWDNAADLAVILGPGRHFGEWWGAGIQRRYGQTVKRFSLFNVKRWGETFLEPTDVGGVLLGAVPVLYDGPFDTNVVRDQVAWLHVNGSVAAPGFMDPEGVVVFHVAAGQIFKVTCLKDEAPKSAVGAA